MISNNLKKRIFTSLFLIFLIFLVFNSKLILVYSLIILGVLSILEFLNITNRIIENKIFLTISNIIFLIYIVIFCSLFLFFFNFLQFKVILFILLFSCAASDIGGFIFGKIFKGPKLSKISPNKTISGSIGSFILTIIIMITLMFYFTNSFLFSFFIVAFITSLTCQCGDLFFSFLKRKANIKDTGNFLPGHGGILDRIDGILFGIPFGFVSMLLFF